MRRILRPRRPWTGAFIALAFIPLLAWTLRDLPFQEIGATLQRLSPWQLLALFTLNGFIFLLFSSRWWLILLAQGYRLPYLALSGYRLSAFSISYFTPGTQFGGEPLQVHWLQNRHAVPGPQALAAVTLDKLFEMMANFTFLALGLLLAFKDSQIAGNLGPAALVLIAFLLVLPLAYLLALWSGHSPLTTLAARLPHRMVKHIGLQKALPWFAEGEQHMYSLIRHKPLTILTVLLLSGLVWALLLAEYWLSLSLLGVQADLIQTIAALTAARLAGGRHQFEPAHPGSRHQLWTVGPAVGRHAVPLPPTGRFHASPSGRLDPILFSPLSQNSGRGAGGEGGRVFIWFLNTYWRK
jgi:uncharacterized protein (TIRG00374 family)